MGVLKQSTILKKQVQIKEGFDYSTGYLAWTLMLCCELSKDADF